METIRIAANGISFEVAQMGTGDRLALCLHGFPEHAFSWRHQLPMLASLGYRVWAPNLRGYGGTDSPSDIAAYRLDVLVEDVAGLIRASGARETVVIGHDWGGVLAWTLAMRQPELLQRLVVCNLPHPACFLREVKRPIQFLRSWYVLLFQIPAAPEALLGMGRAYGIRETFRRTTRDGSKFPEDVLDVYRANALRPGGLKAMIHWYRALLRGGWRQLAAGDFPKIEIPTLLIWGSDDIALSIRTTRGTDQYVSDLTLRVLPGVSHWVQQEAPEAVNALLQAWLTGMPLPDASGGVR
ncbi:MAG TPA: alpha/beta hydrolase [Bryobacteraceae bacterium]|nr:alpha/beta hydrolase [Bryobacteraceae bacterium]